MSIVLFRVDERLIHGQVTVGWGSRLKAGRYVVVDDDLADSEWERELFRLGTPEEAKAEFLSVRAARDRLSQWRTLREPVILLTRNLDHMARLAEGGALEGETVNLGGIHHRPGREQVLPYIFLDDDDRRLIRSLEREGASITAQDLPESPRTSGGRLLDA